MRKYFKWFTDLNDTDLSSVREICGIETYIYLFFMQSSAVFFFGVSLICAPLFIVYLKGEEQLQSEEIRVANRFTIVNAYGDQTKMWTMLMFTLIVSLISILFIYYFYSSVAQFTENF